MVKQLLLPFAAVAAFIVLVGLFTQNKSSIDLSRFFPVASPVSQQKTVTINDKTVVNVEIANTDSLREKGLGGRSSLHEDSGMLFSFDGKKVTPVFWMKGMLIPIDIFWISDNKIIKIDKNVQTPKDGTKDSSLTKYSSGKPVDHVLETNAGFADKNNIKVGDNIDLSKI